MIVTFFQIKYSALMFICSSRENCILFAHFGVRNDIAGFICRLCYCVSYFLQQGVLAKSSQMDKERGPVGARTSSRRSIALPFLPCVCVWTCGQKKEAVVSFPKIAIFSWVHPWLYIVGNILSSSSLSKHLP